MDACHGGFQASLFSFACLRLARLIGTIALWAVVAVSLTTPSVAATDAITVSGKVIAVRPGVFLLYPGSSCGYKDVYFSGNTFFLRNGQSLRSGIYARVTGSGSCFTNVTASVVILSGTPPGAPTDHVFTAGLLGFRNGAPPWSKYAPYMSLGEAYPQNDRGLIAAGISTLQYTNPNRQMVGQPLYTSDESTFAHTCSGSRIVGTSNKKLYLMNPASSNLWSMWKDYIAGLRAAAPMDAILSDDSDDVYGTTGMPCGYNITSWLNATIAEDAHAGAPIIYNGLGLLGPGYSISPSIGLNATAIGGMMEGCYAGFGTYKPGGPIWATIENTELAMSAQQKLFICATSNYTDGSSAIDARRYAYASFMLTYDLNSSILWEGFSTPSDVKLFPESGLVALDPVEPTPTNVSALLTPTSVYGREYLACYIRGTYVGRCASVVNSSFWTTYRFPYTRYHHTLVFAGDGIFDGGRIYANGPPPPTILPPLESAIVFP
jgi:hypothetical protein